LSEARKNAFRYATAFAGQMTLGALGFIINVVLVRSLTPDDFGTYALAVVCATLAASVDGALVCGPLSVFGTRRVGRASRAAVEVLLGSVHVVVMVGILLVSVAISQLVVHRSAVVDFGFSLFVSCFAARSFSRSYAFARQRAEVVLAGDLVLLVTSAAALGIAYFVAGMLSLGSVFYALSASYLLAMCIDLHLQRLPLRVAMRRRTLRLYLPIWRLVRWSLLGSTTTNLQSQAHSFLISSIAGPAAFAPLAAGQVPFGPIRIVNTVWQYVMQPEIAIAIARNDRRMVTRTLYWSMTAMGMFVVVFGLAITLAWDIVFDLLYADKYADSPMGWILSGCFAIALCAALYAAPSGVLQTLLRYRSLALGSMYGSLISIFGTILLTTLYGPVWSLLGILLGEAFFLVYAVIYVESALRYWGSG
jgi:O-antigen/teichoic acid export membrane protein